MQLSVIIVSYNVRFFLEQCLYSVQKAMSGIDGEIIVIDNHSSDKTVEWLAPRFASVHFISNVANLGFAKANNIALAQSKGDHVLFLNPDTLVSENAFSSSLSYMKSHPRAGALGFRMIDGYGKFLPESKRSFPSPLASFFKLAGFAALFPRSGIFNKYALGNKDAHKNQPVDVLAGACLMVRKELITELNGFDESYFMYGEDIDLSYRIGQKGFENHYFADAEILHFKGASSQKQNIGHIKNFYGSMLIFVNKHYKGAKLLIQPAIAVRAAIALAGRYVTRVFHHKKKTVAADRTVVIASAQSYKEVAPVLERFFENPMLPENIPVDMNGLAALKRKRRVEAIIFCEGSDLPLSVIFKQLQMLADKKTKCMFHLTGSEHIAGN